MDGEPRLLKGAVSCVQVSANWTYPRGWQVIVGVRRALESWGEAHQEVYSDLNTEEALDVITAVLATALLGDDVL